MKKIAKKKIKIWGKIKLFETSAVGIASYPDAHLSSECSLIKALSRAGEQLNKEKETIMPEEEKKAEESQETQEPESEAKEPEAEAEAEKPEAEAEEPAKDSKPVTLKDVQEVFSKSLKEALKGSETPRGLVMTEKEVKDELSTKSVGELAMMTGLFKPQ